MKTPKAFCINPKKVKVIVLGADPTNETDNGHLKELDYAFGILSDETRYFSGILKNLNLIGIHLEDIYVQNMVQNYLEAETEKNKTWETDAERSLQLLFEDLKKVKPNIPVLVTAERIMRFLINDKKKLTPAKAIYSNDAKELWYVSAKDNKLNRPLIAFYRHFNYNLSKNNNYKELLSAFIRN